MTAIERPELKLGPAAIALAATAGAVAGSLANPALAVRALLVAPFFLAILSGVSKSGSP